MSQSISTENEEMVQIASNQGWSDFCDWVQELSIDKYPSLHHLVAFGYDNDADDLANELDLALDEEDAEEDIVSTIEGMIDFLEQHDDAEIIIVGNGVTADVE